MSREGQKKWIWRMIFLAFAGLSLIATIRTLFIGLDVDEEYALTLACRLADGDLLVKEMWEPHQTSVLLPAALIRVFQWITGGREFLLIYMRFVGCLMQLGICAFWIVTLRRRFSREAVWLTAFIIYNTLPKWMTLPEFANQQIWFLLLTLLFVINYLDNGKIRFVVFAGIALAVDVLVYPSCALLLIPFLFSLWKRSHKAAGTLLATCMTLGACFVGLLLTYMRPTELVRNITYILDDPEHGAGLRDKFFGYGMEFLQIAVCLAIYVILALACTLLLSRWLRQKELFFFNVLLGIALADQVRLWVMKAVPNVHPQIHYLVLFLVCGVLYYRVRKPEWKELVELTWIPSLVAFLAVLLFTNLDMKASFVHLLPGMLCGLLFLMDEGDSMKSKVLPILWITVLIFARIILLRSNEGVPLDVFCVKQKALYGATKNVYCEYMTGYKLNSDYEFLRDKISDGEKVLYIGVDSCVYLLMNMEICSASTISTPVYNERYLKYYEVNPDKLPAVILIDKLYWETNLSQMNAVQNWIDKNYHWNQREESEFLYLVR